MLLVSRREVLSTQPSHKLRNETALAIVVLTLQVYLSVAHNTCEKQILLMKHRKQFKRSVSSFSFEWWPLRHYTSIVFLLFPANNNKVWRSILCEGVTLNGNNPHQLSYKWPSNGILCVFNKTLSHTQYSARNKVIKCNHFILLPPISGWNSYSCVCRSIQIR